MAQGKKTFIFYSDWINMVREMPDKDAGELLKHVLRFVNDENPQTENILVKMAFGHMKPMLKKDLDKWEEIREKRVKAGAKGGKANAKQKQANAKQVEAVNVNVNVNDNVNENNNVTSKRKNKFFQKPTISEIKDYCLQRQNKINPERFLNYYESNGWKVGRNNMKDWKAAVRNWEQREEKEKVKPLIHTNR